MTGLEVALAVIGVVVTGLVVVGMILITPLGQVPVHHGPDDAPGAEPQRPAIRGDAEPEPVSRASNGERRHPAGGSGM